jgi:rhodanese-related sulfurtransferase
MDIIFIICYVGHTSSQALVILKMLGYNAIGVKFGYGKSPVFEVPIAGWLNFNYPVKYS